jgi:hypothetical protein
MKYKLFIYNGFLIGLNSGCNAYHNMNTTFVSNTDRNYNTCIMHTSLILEYYTKMIYQRIEVSWTAP